MKKENTTQLIAWGRRAPNRMNGILERVVKEGRGSRLQLRRPYQANAGKGRHGSKKKKPATIVKKDSGVGAEKTTDLA